MKRLTILSAIALASMLSMAEPPKVQNQGQSTVIQSGDTQVKIEKGADSNSNAQASEFLGSFTMNVNTTPKNGKSLANSMSLYIRSFETAIEMSQPGAKSVQPLRMILNSQTNDVISLMSDGSKKTGMKTKMPKITVSGLTDDQKKDCVVQITDETKVIEGYTCRKYIIKYNDGAVMETWITQEVKLNLANLMNMVSSGMKGKGQENGSKYPNMQGMGLEMTYTSQNGTVSHTQISNLKLGEPDAAKFSTDGYQVVDLSGMNLPIFGQ